MKYGIQFVLVIALILAGFFGYTRYREGEILKERVAAASLSMDQNFSMMMNGWNFSQIQMLFTQVMSVGQLQRQMDRIRQDFGACQLEPNYMCEATMSDEKLVEKTEPTVFCQFDMSCEKTKGTGEVTWIEQNDTLKIQKFRVRKI